MQRERRKGPTIDPGGGPGQLKYIPVSSKGSLEQDKTRNTLPGTRAHAACARTSRPVGTPSR